MTTHEVARRKEIPRIVLNRKQFRRRGPDKWELVMTTGQQVGIVLIVGIMVIGAIAASTKVQPQPSAHGREAPSVFDGVLSNVAGSPEMSTAELRAALMESSAIVLDASTSREIDAAFATFMRERPDALFVGADPFFNSRRVQLALLAAQHSIPATYAVREMVEVGGLMSYGSSMTDAWRQVGIYTGRILKGAKPADLPVVQSTKFELVINLKTAKALGLEIPPTLLARAGEVIE
jgi:ABC transporter substrate binding protein